MPQLAQLKSDDRRDQPEDEPTTQLITPRYNYSLPAIMLLS